MGSFKRLETLGSHLSSSIKKEDNHLDMNETAGQSKPKAAGSPLTTHVLDTALGKPAGNLRIQLYYLVAGQWKTLAEGSTNADGRCPDLLTQEQFLPGIYKILFDTGAYFKAIATKGFYPFVEVVFEIEDPCQHYHVPLLLSPFSYSTYRGS